MNNREIIFTENSNKLSVILENKHFIITILKNEYRTLIKNLIHEYNLTFDNSVLETIKSYFIVKKQELNEYIDSINGSLYLKGTTTKIPEELAEIIKEYIQAGYNINGLVNFWKNCLEHPHQPAISELFEFCANNLMPINSFGHIIGYKKLNYVKSAFSLIQSNSKFNGLYVDVNGTVRGIGGRFVSPVIAKEFIEFQNSNLSENTSELFTDVYSGTINQRLGEWVEQPLPDNWDWETEKRYECGVGLHVGSFNYSFGGNVRLLVEVRPQDIVACESSNRKFRCIKYKNLCLIDETHEVTELYID